MIITNTSQQTILADKAGAADTPLSRLVGLLNRKSLSLGEALIISDCRCIHMVFMRFALDVVFADRHKRVVGLAKNIKPFCFSWYYWRAYYAIELPVGVIASSRTDVGDTLAWDVDGGNG